MGLTRQNTLLLAAAVGSVLVGLHDALFYWRNVEPGSQVSSLWPVVFVVLLVLWVDDDSHRHPEVLRPFEFGFLVFLFWLPYLPYYMWRTRGLRGLAFVALFTILGLLGDLLMWGIYVAR
jgi:hypothetical protein